MELNEKLPEHVLKEAIHRYSWKNDMGSDREAFMERTTGVTLKISGDVRKKLPIGRC